MRMGCSCSVCTMVRQRDAALQGATSPDLHSERLKLREALGETEAAERRVVDGITKMIWAAGEDKDREISVLKSVFDRMVERDRCRIRTRNAALAIIMMLEKQVRKLEGDALAAQQAGPAGTPSPPPPPGALHDELGRVTRRAFMSDPPPVTPPAMPYNALREFPTDRRRIGG